MKKEKIKNILLIVIVALVTSFVTAYGVSSTFDSSNVCYKVDSNTGASVQDTIDDLYGRASDYSELKSYFQNNPTSILDANYLNVSKNATGSNNNSYVTFYSNGVRMGAVGYDAAAGKMQIAPISSSGNWGQGTLNLRGNPVMINGNHLNVNGKLDYYVFSNTNTFSWTVPSPPSNVHYGSYLIFNANNSNQYYLGLYNANSNSLVKISGPYSFTTTVSGTTITLTANTTLWGKTIILGCFE